MVENVLEKTEKKGYGQMLADPLAGPIYVGLLGCGTVGTGVLEILRRHPERMTAVAGRPLKVRRILVRDLHRPRPDVVERRLLTANAADILDDPDIRLVVEVMGGAHPAYEYVEAALRAGKHVVTANKEMLALLGSGLFAAAQAGGVSIGFEASVAGGIPVVKALRESLAANELRQVMGIVNGTTNYILTAMSEKGQDFSDALREAQALGYAEADPAADIEGLDAAYKLAILAQVAFGVHVPVEEIWREGITGIEASDIAYARELGYVIKLLAVARCDDSVSLWVRPTLVPLRHPLAAVKNSFNALYVQGDAVGELMFYGRGAGSLPTASAVVADMLDAARRIVRSAPAEAGAAGVTGAGPACRRAGAAGGAGPAAASAALAGTVAGRQAGEEKAVGGKTAPPLPVRPASQQERQFYIRTTVADRPGVLAQIAGAFGRWQVSLATVIQKGTGHPGVPLVFVTHRVREANLRAALREIASFRVVARIHNVLPLEEEQGNGQESRTAS
ncbi:MAG: homoserine dehydrogenase [Firmicutes bacterium]|nr:homoserine dehydrogenase [Bacillota bacterium]